MDLTQPDQFIPRWWSRALLGLVAALAGAGRGPAADDVPRASVRLEDRPSRGSVAAPVTIVEVSSFKCAHCRDFHQQTFPTLRAQYIDTGKVRWVVLNASDDPADQYGKAFAIARCALRQGKYWEIVDELHRSGHRAPSFLEGLIAANVHLDPDALALCLRDRGVRTAVVEDFAEYARLKLKGTPSFIVSKAGRDGRRIETVISGAEKLEYFQRVIDRLLEMP